MTWTKLDDSFYDHPKIIQVGNEAVGAFTRSLAYCGRHNTDGRLPRSQGLLLAEGRKSVVARLVEVGLWIEDGDELVIPDYLDFNPSRARVEEERRKAAERQAKSRAKSR